MAEAPGFDQETFVSAHREPDRVNAVRLNAAKPAQAPATEAPEAFALGAPVPWCEAGYYLAQRPRFSRDPLWHGGAYYVQDASSMSLSFVVRRLAPRGRPLRILDLCAAPGGKTTLLMGVMPPGSFVVANEVISSRAPVLEENVVKWGAAGVVVTRNDPRDFGGLEGFFDVIVVDAPCSGSGLFRKDPGAVKGWSPSLVELCQGRQQRITAEVAGALAPGGLLVYSTCSYSPAEDERISEFIRERCGMEALEVPFDKAWGIVESRGLGGTPLGYRFFPDKLAGEGFYLSAFRKPEATPRTESGKKRPGQKGLFQPLGRAQRELLAPSVDGLQEQVEPLEWRGEVVLMPAGTTPLVETLASRLRVVSAGTRAGKFLRGEFMADHGLAMSPAAGRGIARAELGLEDALRYLMKEPVTLPGAAKGRVLVSYRGVGLGWAKQLAGRVNNYYPTAWRLR
jgi:16S rRNA C967 or C1407 C5-methylase (RsmB/RsmF family)/NOL1/NOP2/fmu family ribosome biogenesis protein